MKKSPRISVVMPVYNTGEYLVEALNSVCNQTYSNLEIIAVDDGSIDNCFSLLQSYALREKRLKVFRFRKNRGVAKAASFGMKKAGGAFIARMDSDDIMPVDRIENQANYLTAHPDVIVVGGQVELVNKDGLFIVHKQFPKGHEDIVNMAFTAMPIQQGAMMINKKLLPVDFVWYKKRFKTSEDLDFFFRTFQYGKTANLEDVCLYYRQHGQSLTQVQNPKEIFYQAYKVRQIARQKYGIHPKPIPMIMSYTQYAFIKLLPTSLVYPLYYLWRGIRPLQPSKNGYQTLFQHASSYVF